MKRIAVLGSTGSIGTQTMDIVRANSEELEVKVIAAGSNIVMLEEQIREFNPKIAVVYDEKKAEELKIKPENKETNQEDNKEDNKEDEEEEVEENEEESEPKTEENKNNTERKRKRL